MSFSPEVDGLRLFDVPARRHVPGRAGGAGKKKGCRTRRQAFDGLDPASRKLLIIPAKARSNAKASRHSREGVAKAGIQGSFGSPPARG
jgi:hypothetical protein